MFMHGKLERIGAETVEACFKILFWHLLEGLRNVKM
jgi:hypothetical protein